MGLRYLEHFLILTDDPDATRDWFCDNLGLRSGDHPAFEFPVHWLYIGDQDVIHIGKARFSAHQSAYMRAPGDAEQADESAAGAMGSGRIDHICFNCNDLKGVMQRLKDRGVAFSERKAHNSQVYQLFMREPVNGIKVELNFPWEEAVALGCVPGLTTGFAKEAGNT